MAKKMGDILNSPSMNAPMYVDFAQGTPNASAKLDDFFEVIHPEHDKYQIEDLASPLDSLEESNIGTWPSSDGGFMQGLDTIQMTPVKIISPSSKNEPPVIDETTVGSVFDNVNDILASISKKKKNLLPSLDKSLITQKDKIPIKTPKKIRISKSLHNTKFDAISDENIDKSNVIKKTRRSVASSATKENIKTLGAKVQVDLTIQDELDIGEAKKVVHKPIRMGTRVTRSMANKSLIESTINSEIKQIDELSEKVQNVSLDDTLVSEDKPDDVSVKSDPENINSIIVEMDCHDKQLEEDKIILDAVINSVQQVDPGSLPSISTEGIKKLITKAKPLNIQNMNESGDSISKILAAAKEMKTGSKCEKIPEKSLVSVVNEETNDYQHIDDFEKFQVHQINYDKQKPAIKIRGKPTVLATTHARRRSSIMASRQPVNKYISIAEAVKKFHRATPDRFRSTKPVTQQLQKIAKYEPKRTVPMSPALQSKTRTRRHHVLSQAEREELELQEMKKNKVQANPLRTSILAAAKPLKEVAKKPITVPKPFHLTKINQKSQVVIEKPTTSTDHSQPPKKPVIVKKNIVPVVSTNNGTSVTLTQTQILHFGIPTQPKSKTITHMDRHDTKKKIIQPLSTAFDERNKQFLDKKEQKLKKLQTQEAEKLKAEFHARPVPSIIKKVSKKIDNPEKTSENNHNTKPAPFSFEQRDKSVIKKKDELRKKIEEEEKKKRVFHANPAPHFKPVTVRVRSKENLQKDDKTQNRLGHNTTLIEKSKSADNLGVNLRLRANSTDRCTSNRGFSRGNLKPISRGASHENLKPISRASSRGNIKPISRGNSRDNLKIKKDIDQENQAPNNQAGTANMPTLKAKLQPFELHSDKRAKLRKDFDENIRLKIEMDEIKRKREQAEQLEREQLEINQMRKKAETKARPMPVFKAPIVAKSNKPLTAPESPAWARRFQKH